MCGEGCGEADWVVGAVGGVDTVVDTDGKIVYLDDLCIILGQVTPPYFF